MFNFWSRMFNFWSRMLDLNALRWVREDFIASAPPISRGEEVKQQTEHFSTASTVVDRVSPRVNKPQDNIQKTDKPVRNTSGAPSGPAPARLPTFHASAQGPWYSVIAYDACVRVCLHGWAKQCMEAPMFLENECALLREAFGLQQVLLQSEKELLVKCSSDLVSEVTTPEPKKVVGACRCGSVTETVAYDLVLEVAMKILHFQQRNLLLHGPWKWLLKEFASYFGISDAYTRLRYLSYVMDVATPTTDCLNLIYEFLYPVVMKGHSKSTLSHLENRILGEIKDQTNQILALVFENYKALDESVSSGMIDDFRPTTGSAAPALVPALKLYRLLHDIFSPEPQTKLCGYFQAAAEKRSKRLLMETNEFVTSNEGILMDSVTMSTAYQKMRTLCLNIRNEINTDIEIQKKDILPSFIDLPSISSAIYNVELCSILRAFLSTCPPAGPSPSVAKVIVATADLQRDFATWNIKGVGGGVDAKELFHLYIILWIQDKRLSLLETCKLDKVKWSGVRRTQHLTTPFVDEMYERLKETLNEYEFIICRWPEYTFVLENAVADVEKAIVEALDKQYADVLSPLKENMAPKKFGLKYVQKLTKRSVCPYVVPDELGILLNSLKRMLDTLRPKIEQQLKSWGSRIPEGGNTVPGDRFSEVTVMLRFKFCNYLQAVVEKLAENTRLQNTTKLKKILKDSKESVVESDIRGRIQPLKEQLLSTINHLHTIFETRVFISICRGFWGRMGQDVLSFLENRIENKSWYKGSRVAVSVLGDTFASQMQQLLGRDLQEKDLEPPKTIIELGSMLCRNSSSL